MKALVGSWDNRPHRLLAEASALRARVAELQAELEQVREENTMLRNALDVVEVRAVDEREIALSTS